MVEQFTDSVVKSVVRPYSNEFCAYGVNNNILLETTTMIITDESIEKERWI
jgi:hypothetical protein